MKNHRKLIVIGVLLALLPSSATLAQHVRVQRGIPYCQALYPGQDKMQNLCFDFYEPVGEGDSMRPLVITVFGGGFVVGTRDYEDMTAWCNQFAKNGYAAASIDYRLMPARKLKNKELLRAGFMAAQDVSAAVRFFKANSQKYHIDTNRIFLLGQSAGAVAILHAIYMDEDERPAATFEEPSLPALHSTGSPESLSQPFSVAGAVLLWGCIFRPDMIDADETTPVCLIHGGKDKILPVDSGYAFSIPGSPYVYGSQVIADRLKELGTTSFEFHLQEQESHAFYFKYLCLYQLDAIKFDNCFQTAYDFMERTGKRQ